MGAQRFLVSANTDGRAQSLPWDSSGPLLFGKTPEAGGWLLESTDSGDLRLRSLGEHSAPTKANSKIIPLHAAKEGIELKLHCSKGREVALKIHGIQKIRASEAPMSASPTANQNLGRGFIAYSTVSDWTTQMSMHRKEYRASWLQREIFRVVVTANGMRVLAKKSGIRIYVDGVESELAEDGERLLTKNEFFSARMSWGNHQWRFGGVNDVVKDPAFDSYRFVPQEQDFYTAGFSLLLLMQFLFGGKFLREDQTEAPPVDKPLPTDTVKFLRIKPRPAGTETVVKAAEAPKFGETPKTAETPKFAEAPKVASSSPSKPNPTRPSRLENRLPNVKENLKSVSRIPNLVSGEMKKILHTDGLLQKTAASQDKILRSNSKEFSDRMAKVAFDPGARDRANKGGLLDGKVAGIGGIHGSGVSNGNGKDGPLSVVGGGGRKSDVSLGGDGAEIDEGLSREEVGRVIHAHIDEVRYCYENSITRAPASKIEGQIGLAFTIRADGRVVASSVSQSSVKDAYLGDCVRKHLNTWTFPKPKGGVNVKITYPFHFNTLGGD